MSEQRQEYAQTLERGLAALRAFDRDHPSMSLSEVATRCGMSRAAARRYLLTLEKLGYLVSNEGRFSPSVKVLEFCEGYFGARPFWNQALPRMREASAAVNDACSLAVLDWPDVVYVGRVPARRIMTISLNLGSRLPAAATSMGRVLLAALPRDEARCLIRSAPLTRHTAFTKTDPDALDEELTRVRTQGYALVDQELEEGLISVAVPVRDGTGAVVAAMNMSCHAGRNTAQSVLVSHLPVLRDAAQRVSMDLGGALAFSSGYAATGSFTPQREVS